jgi:hypothetical protein
MPTSSGKWKAREAERFAGLCPHSALVGEFEKILRASWMIYLDAVDGRSAMKRQGVPRYHLARCESYLSATAAISLTDPVVKLKLYAPECERRVSSKVNTGWELCAITYPLAARTEASSFFETLNGLYEKHGLSRPPYVGTVQQGRAGNPSRHNRRVEPRWHIHASAVLPSPRTKVPAEAALRADVIAFLAAPNEEMRLAEQPRSGREKFLRGKRSGRPVDLRSISNALSYGRTGETGFKGWTSYMCHELPHHPDLEVFADPITEHAVDVQVAELNAVTEHGHVRRSEMTVDQQFNLDAAIILRVTRNKIAERLQDTGRNVLSTKRAVVAEVIEAWMRVRGFKTEPGRSADTREMVSTDQEERGGLRMSAADGRASRHAGMNRGVESLNRRGLHQAQGRTPLAADVHRAAPVYPFGPILPAGNHMPPVMMMGSGRGPPPMRLREAVRPLPELTP